MAAATCIGRQLVLLVPFLASNRTLFLLFDSVMSTLHDLCIGEEGIPFPAYNWTYFLVVMVVLT